MNIFLPGCSAAIKLCLRRTLVLLIREWASVNDRRELAHFLS